jgi:hypothetical protein
MKTIALTLLAAALGCAQSQSSQSADSAKAAAASKATRRAVPGVALRVPPRIPPKVGSTAASQKPAPSASQHKTEPQPQVQSIPAGATQVEPNLYRYTDSSGKTWNYRQTPFGISKWEETSAPAVQSTPAKSEPVAVTDQGDSYRFEKKTPFGNSSWVRKKSELTDEEKALTGGQQAPSIPSQNSENSKPAGNR